MKNGENSLNLLVNTIVNSPTWIKEVILLDLNKHLAQQIPDIAAINEENVYAVYVPEITYMGKQELETHNHKHELNVYKYLNSAHKKQRIADITLNNFWTLEESSKHLSHCIKHEYIKLPPNPVISASMFYLASEIRIGEYAKRVKVIDVDQLEAALRKQKEVNESTNSYKKLGDVLVEMGYLESDDIIKILKIKDESRTRFILDLNTQSASNTDNEELQEKIEKLSYENNFLKDKLRAVFNIQNKKA